MAALFLAGTVDSALEIYAFCNCFLRVAKESARIPGAWEVPARL